MKTICADKQQQQLIAEKFDILKNKFFVYYSFDNFYFFVYIFPLNSDDLICSVKVNTIKNKYYGMTTIYFKDIKKNTLFYIDYKDAIKILKQL